jgi:hypothetical protein
LFFTHPLLGFFFCFWFGLTATRRIALHKYDPIDLQQAFVESQALENTQKNESFSSNSTDELLTVKEQQLIAAKASGLLDLIQLERDDNDVPSSSSTSTLHSYVSMKEVTNTALTCNEKRNQENSILDEWERAGRNISSSYDDDGDDDFSILDSPGIDSDDDLL